jgi:hypothetical protein
MNFQEVILIPRSEYERHDTSENKALNLELTRIKNNNAFSTHERNTKYVDKLNTLMSSNKKVRAPMELTLKRTLDDDGLDLKNELPDDFAVSRIKELLPASKRRRGMNLYEKLKHLPQVIESERTVRINNVLLKNSLLDFVGEALSPNSARGNLAGFENFVQLLMDTNAKSNSVVNQDYKDVLKDLKVNKKASQSAHDSTLDASLDGSGWVKNWKRFYF